jgi:hypothetical protein
MGERYVPPNHLESNYDLAMWRLFAEGLPGNCMKFRVKAVIEKIEFALRRYDAFLT